MRIALAQINTVVGDIEGNLARCLESIDAARATGASVTLMPELALTGYPPEDLLLKKHFVDDNLEALEELAKSSKECVLVGFVDRVDGKLFNACALLASGRVAQVYHKRKLPNYGVFDERRYFARGSGPAFNEVDGVLVATTVCEDIWVPGPAEEAARAHAKVLLNISASPFHAGKSLEREDLLIDRARSNGLWVAYCNLVGGQDELVFDGASMVVSPSGKVVARGKAFEEDLVVADISVETGDGHSDDMEPVLRGPEEVYSAIRLGLRDYATKNGFSDVVLGLSGGIDSALTAAVAADALGPEHVHGVLMPSKFSSRGSVDDALELAVALDIDSRTIPIEGPHEAFLAALAPSFKGKKPGLAEENLQARIRGTLLMGLSNKFGWLAIATGNKSELSVGYSTLYGDMVGGFAPLKDVYKTGVYELAEFRNGLPDGPVIPESTMLKAPSAELKENQTDQDSLPPYEVLDAILNRYIERDMSADDIVAQGFDEGTVAEVIGMTDAAEFKRRQGPLGVKLTIKAFGKDRRVPVTNRYRG